MCVWGLDYIARKVEGFDSIVLFKRELEREEFARRGQEIDSSWIVLH